MNITLNNARKMLKSLGTKERAEVNRRYFKAEDGGYGAGDLFYGVTVPETRKTAKLFKGLPLKDIETLLKSKVHEERLLALEILDFLYSKATVLEKEKIYSLYIKNIKYVNNWDLIDGSAPNILGQHLENKNKSLLKDFVKSNDLWKKRIAMMSTFYYIKKNDFSLALQFAQALLNDDHDLIHKAVGWMLREIGNRNLKTEETFLKKHYKKMPRTMLRYAIEKFPEAKRKRYLKGLI